MRFGIAFSDREKAQVHIDKFTKGEGAIGIVLEQFDQRWAVLELKNPPRVSDEELWCSVIEEFGDTAVVSVRSEPPKTEEDKDLARSNFLQILDNSDREVTDWESKFLERNLGATEFTANQRRVIDRMMDKYRYTKRS